MDDLPVFKTLNFFFFFLPGLVFEPESLEDEKDENHRKRQMQGNTVVMHICALERWVSVCMCGTHERISQCVCVSVCVSLCPVPILMS